MEEWEEPTYVYATHAQQVTAIQTVTTKIPASYDGRSSWFAYEEAVDNWLDVTELEEEKWGPALRNRHCWTETN